MKHLILLLVLFLAACQGSPGATDTQAPINPGTSIAGTGQPGPQGEKGDTGPQGPQGARGDTGPQGNPGASGQDGLDGVDGQDGRDGTDGTPGATGATGPAGPTGGTPTLVVTNCALRVELVQGTAIFRQYYAKISDSSIDPANDTIRAMTCGGVHFRRNDSCDTPGNNCTGPEPTSSLPGSECAQVPAYIDHGSAWVSCGFEQWDSTGLVERTKFSTARFTFQP